LDDKKLEPDIDGKEAIPNRAKRADSYGVHRPRSVHELRRLHGPIVEFLAQSASDVSESVQKRRRSAEQRLVPLRAHKSLAKVGAVVCSARAGSEGTCRAAAAR
jgi:hypothetical protein